MQDKYNKTILSNGLKVISHHMADRRSFALGIWINAGGRYEASWNKGISHYLEHMLFKGTSKYSCRKIKESIEGVGGALNGFTSEEFTCYLVKMPANYWKTAVNVLSDMVQNPSLPEKEIEKERAVILEEIKMYKDLPQSYVHDLLDELLWPNQPLGEPIIGWVESVNGIKRDNLYQFKQEYYNPSNIVVSAAGNVSHEELAGYVSSKFCKQATGAKSTFTLAQSNQNNPQLKILYKETEQTHMALGFHALRREHPLKYALSMLNVILGANMSSRLFNELREKRGLAYEIGTQVKRFSDTGSFVVHAGIDNRKVPQALELILKELQICSAKPAGRNEFLRAKEFYLGQLMLALEDVIEHMLWIGESTAALNKAYLLDEVIAAVKKLKLEDLLEAAKMIFNKENLNVAIIGPLKDKDDFILSKLKNI